MELSGSRDGKIELPRRDGATRLVKHTLADHLGDTLDYFLAFKVVLPDAEQKASSGKAE